jgi:hypothetical protein
VLCQFAVVVADDDGSLVALALTLEWFGKQFYQQLWCACHLQGHGHGKWQHGLWRTKFLTHWPQMSAAYQHVLTYQQKLSLLNHLQQEQDVFN